MSTWVVVLGSHEPYHSSACWVFDDQAIAELFAAYITREIDPAQVLRALDPMAELAHWREHYLAVPVHYTDEEPDQPACDADVDADPEILMQGTPNPDKVTCSRCLAIIQGHAHQEETP